MKKIKNINERCPFSQECGRRKCVFELREAKCPYYSANAMPGNEIEDQKEENTYLPEEMDFLNEPDEEEAWMNGTHEVFKGQEE